MHEWGGGYNPYTNSPVFTLFIWDHEQFYSISLFFLFSLIFRLRFLPVFSPFPFLFPFPFLPPVTILGVRCTQRHHRLATPRPVTGRPYSERSVISRLPPGRMSVLIGCRHCHWSNSPIGLTYSRLRPVGLI